MKPSEQISPLRLLGFYQLKELLGLGDDRLKMLLAVGNVEPIIFTNSRTGRTDKMYSYQSVMDAIQRLQGVDVQALYETNLKPESDEVEKKYEDVHLRLIRKRKAGNG